MNTKRLDKIKSELGIFTFDLTKFDSSLIEYIYIPDGYPDKLVFPFNEEREFKILNISEEDKDIYASLKIKKINDEVILVLPNQVSNAYSFFYVYKGVPKWLVGSHSAVSAANYLQKEGLINEVDFLSDL